MTVDGQGAWLPYEDTQRPDVELAHCRFELFPAPGGVIAIFASDYDDAGNIMRWLVGQALQAKAKLEADGCETTK